jgi:hypothetical protein
VNDAADLLLSVWKWLPHLFLLDFLVVSLIMLASRRRYRAPAPEVPEQR